MKHVEDPYKQIGYLQQCLSSDKKSLGIFLGAGCPMAIRLGTEGKPLVIQPLGDRGKDLLQEFLA